MDLSSGCPAPWGRPQLRGLSRGLRVGWRRRKKTHKIPQMGGSLAGQEEGQGGPRLRCGTSSKGVRSVQSRGPPAWPGPGAACPRPRRYTGSAWAESSLPGPGQERRWELELYSTPLQASQDSPEGWEKPPGRLSWMGEFRRQPAPPGGRAGQRCSQGCGRGGLRHCGCPAAREGGA